jgi:hypothetical protein
MHHYFLPSVPGNAFIEIYPKEKEFFFTNAKVLYLEIKFPLITD